MWVYNVDHTRFSEFRNVSVNLFLIFTRLWTKVVVSIKASPNGKFNGYPSISCNSPGTWVIDGPAFYSRSWFICPDSLSQLIMSYVMNEGKRYSSRQPTSNISKQTNLRTNFHWSDVQSMQIARSIHIIVHPT